MFIGSTDAEAETPILWPPHAKSWLISKDPDAGRDWGQEEKETTEDEMAGWHHRLDGRESQWTPGVGDGRGGLACCDSWGCKELDTTERLNWTEGRNIDGDRFTRGRGKDMLRMTLIFQKKGKIVILALVVYQSGETRLCSGNKQFKHFSDLTGQMFFAWHDVYIVWAGGAFCCSYYVGSQISGDSITWFHDFLPWEGDCC